MNDGVRLILERIETNPEEFWPLYQDEDKASFKECRFFHLVDDFINHSGVNYRYLDPEDFDAIKNRINKFRQDEFSQAMFSRIVGGADLETKKHLDHLRNTPSGIATHGLSMAQQQAQLQATHMQLHQQQLAYQAAQSQGLIGGGGGGAWNSMKGFFGGGGGKP